MSYHITQISKFFLLGIQCIVYSILCIEKLALFHAIVATYGSHHRIIDDRIAKYESYIVFFSK